MAVGATPCAPPGVPPCIAAWGDFSGEIFRGFEVVHFSMSVTMTQLLSSGKFCKLRYDTIPVKSASANVSSLPITQKCQILSCDAFLANEGYKQVSHVIPQSSPLAFGTKMSRTCTREGPKNNENFFLEGTGTVLPSAPTWCVYVTALCISWPSGVLEERSIGSV